MVATTRTLFVNAAFLEEVKEDNIHLRDLLMAASKVLSSNVMGTNINPRALADLFQEIRDQLATHFSLEEAFGYLEDAIITAPRLSETAFALRNEHSELYMAISDLADDAYACIRNRSSWHVIPQLLERFRSFCRQLKRHEADENELIMQALYDELGVGD